MRRILPPLWLAAPGRLAGIARGRAMIVTAVLAALLVIGWTARPAAAPGLSDMLPLYDGVIAGLRAGGDYYTLTAQTLRADGEPLKPFTAFRLPTHVMAQAALPPVVVIALLYALACGVIAAWWVRLRAALTRPPARFSAAILVCAGLVPFVQPGLAVAHEIWAALLVALALALRTSERWTTSVAIALVAMLVRETAAVLPVVMAGFAWRQGAKREAAGWMLALLAFALVLVAHAWAVSHVVGPLDAGAPGWAGPNGPGDVVRMLADASALRPLPVTLAVPLILFALFGWTAWRDPLADRTTALVAGCVIAMLAGGGLSWALMPAPILLAGLVFAPDGVRDLAAALLDRRRVRVQRVSR